MEAFHWKVSFVLLTQPTDICHLLYQCKLQTFIGVASSKMVIGHDVFVRRACRITRGILSTATAAVHFLRLVQQPDHKRRLTNDQYNPSLRGIVQEVRWEGLGEEGIYPYMENRFMWCELDYARLWMFFSQLLALSFQYCHVGRFNRGEPHSSEPMVWRLCFGLNKRTKNLLTGKVWRVSVSRNTISGAIFANCNINIQCTARHSVDFSGPRGDSGGTRSSSIICVSMCYLSILCVRFFEQFVPI